EAVEIAAELALPLCPSLLGLASTSPRWAGAWAGETFRGIPQALALANPPTHRVWNPGEKARARASTPHLQGCHFHPTGPQPVRRLHPAVLCTTSPQPV